MGNIRYSAEIRGIGMFVPEKILTNDDIAKMVDTSDEWITSKLGIKERHIASDKEAASDLSIPAALEAIKSAGIKPEDIELIIQVCQLPDHITPSTAAIIQGKIGAKNSAVFDMQAGCQGFLHGVAVGSKFINDGTYENVLVISTSLTSKMIDWKERTVCVFFGDGAGAVVLSRCSVDKGIQSIDLGCDGTKTNILKIPAGGSRMPLTHELLDDNYARYGGKMAGKAIYEFATNIIPFSINKAMEKINRKVEDLDFVILHQANLNIIEEGLKRTGIPMEKTFTNIDRYGNTSEASIPIALYEAVKKKLIRKDDLIGLTAFGVGLGWGTIILKWGMDNL